MTVPFGPVTPGTPTTSITSPTGGQSFTAPASISISATAADTDGTITKVEFYNGGTKLGEDTTSPYNFTWSSVPAGSYSLTTKATDNAGNIGTSAPVSVSVQPGVVASYKVEFFAGTTKIGEDIDDNLLSPFGGIWTPTVAGTYVITAKATRMSDGIVANSSPVNITVNTSVGTSDPTKGDFKIYRLSSTDAVLPVSFGADLVFDGATTTENPAIYNNVLASVYTSTTSQPNFHYMKVRNIPGYQVGRSVCSYTRGSSECLVPTSYSKINCSDGWCLDQAGVSPNTVTKIAYRYIPGAPIVTLTATPTTVSPGQSTTLTWSVTGTTKTNPCTAYDGWTGKKAASGTQVITGLTSTRKFKLVCSGGSGYGEANVIVNVVVQTNQPPTALIRYTGPSGSVYRGDVLPFNITATDSDGSISKVEFYVDDQLTSTDTSAPYDFSWTVPMTPYVSTHTFYGVSYDNLGERTQSNVAQGNISTLRDSSPIVKISPTTSQAAPASYTVTVINDYLPGEEVETGFKVNKIEFVRNGTVINTDTTYPYEFVDSNVPAGSYSYVARMTATVEGQTYDENSNTVSATVTGSTPPDTSVSGLKGEYFNNTSWSGTPVVTKVDSNVNFNWGGDAPTAGVNADEFSVRWTGKVIPRYSEPYEFHLAGDDGASLSINGQAVSGWWTPVTMVAGQEYSIEVKHYENFGGASVTLEWKSPSQAREVIPSSQFKTSPLARLTDDTLVAAVANATEPVVRGIAIASVVVLLGVGVALISKKRHQ
jgi:hypothetical protein